MQGVFRKLYMSIIASALILLTSIATTFAWVGMLTSSSLGSFDIDLKVEKFDSEYYLTISNTDSINSGDYKDSISRIDIQKQIMDNMLVDYSKIDSNDQTAVDILFGNKCMLTPVTTDVNLTEFYAMDNLGNSHAGIHRLDLNPSKLYYKFDAYLSVNSKLGLDASTRISANVFFENIKNALVGNICEGEMVDKNPFTKPTYPSLYSVLPSIPEKGIKINSASAARLAFAIYEPIRMDQTYSSNVSPKNIIIYQGGTKYPTLNDGVYSLGGILPEEYNLALKRLETIYKVNLDLDASATARMGYDIELDSANNHIWNAPEPDQYGNFNVKYLGSWDGVQTKMKISIYFWFEGWDADCLEFIDRTPVSIGVSFSTDKTTITP